MKRLLSCLVFAGLSIAASLAQDLTQAELEKMVSELDAVGVRNPKYIYPIKCYVIDDPEVNASATIAAIPKEGEKPQAVMKVHTGLVKYCNGDRRIIRAVVAHEVAHLMQGHVYSKSFVARDLKHTWDRRQEVDADITGAMLLEKAGYSKKDMIEMLAMLDKLEAKSGWMWRLAHNDHTSAKNRAAEVAGSTAVMRSMMAFEHGLAFMECRSYGTAGNLFENATKLEPKFLDAYVNAAQASLMDYHDNLPVAVRDTWFIPDFGPVLSENPINNRGSEVTPEDIERFKVAMRRVQAAKAVKANDPRVLELEQIALAIDPEANKEQMMKAGDQLAKSTTTGSNYDRVRFANNAGMAYHRAGDLQKSYDTILATLKATRNFSNQLAQNLGRFNVTNRPKEDELLVLDVMVQWLNSAPTTNVYYDIVKTKYIEGCTKAGVQAKTTTPKPTYLCSAADLTLKGKQAPLFVETADFLASFGNPTERLKISDQFPDVQFWVWNGGELSVLTERERVIRVTTQSTGAYLDLRPKDETVNIRYRIIVGMTEADFAKILDLNKSVEKKVVGVTGIETWNYYPNLYLGVLRKDGRIAGITVSPVAED